MESFDGVKVPSQGIRVLIIVKSAKFCRTIRSRIHNGGGVPIMILEFLCLQIQLLVHLPGSFKILFMACSSLLYNDLSHRLA